MKLNTMLVTDAEGPGRRLAIWTAGCKIRCPGCCNPEMFSPKGQLPDMTAAELADKILSTNGIEGVSLLGGEPTEWAEELCEVISLVRERSGLTFMLYTGHYVKDLSGAALGLAMACDLVVEGPYDQTKPESEKPYPRRWIGSWNQNVLFNTNRYSDIDFIGKNTVELRIENGKVVISGWPGSTRELPPFRRTS